MRSLLIIHLFLSLLLPVHLLAQADSILALPEENQTNALWDWYALNIDTDSTLFVEKLQEFESVFAKHKAKELQREAWVMLPIYLSGRFHRWTPKAIEICNTAISEAIDRGWETQEVRLIMHKGSLLYEHMKYPAALENVIIAYKRMKQIGYDKFAIPHDALLNIANLFYQLGDYDNASKYLREGLSMKGTDHNFAYQVHANNTLGLCYLHMAHYDSAIHYLGLAHKAAVIQKDSFWMALTNGNKGHAHYMKGDYQGAIPLLQEDFRKSNQLEEFGSATNAALSLASVYVSIGEKENAEFYMDYARRHVEHSDIKSMSFFYKTLYLSSKINGDFTDAARYVDSFLFFKNQVDSINDHTIIGKAKLKVEVDQHARELRLLEETRSRQVLIRNGMLAILVLSGIIAFLWISRQQLKRKKKLELAEMQNKLSEEQLRLAHQELHSYTNTIKEKNELIHAFNDQIEELRLAGVQHLAERAGHLTELMNSTLLTEDDWKHFRVLFDQVHPGFFMRLKEKMPDLTPAETRLLALTKLQLASREMASMLGISYESIKKSRQRLRKKVNLHEEGSLDELVEMI